MHTCRRRRRRRRRRRKRTDTVKGPGQAAIRENKMHKQKFTRRTTRSDRKVDGERKRKEEEEEESVEG